MLKVDSCLFFKVSVLSLTIGYRYSTVRGDKAFAIALSASYCIQQAGPGPKTGKFVLGIHKFTAQGRKTPGNFSADARGHGLYTFQQPQQRGFVWSHVVAEHACLKADLSVVGFWTRQPMGSPAGWAGIIRSTHCIIQSQ